MASVSLQQVSKRFDGTRAMIDIDLDVPTGRFLTLLGPSGCGKTTTLRSIAGLVQPDAGSIRIDGEDVTRLPAYRRNLAMVFQSHALFGHMTVLDNVGFGLRMRGVDRAERRRKAQAALELVGLGGMATRHPHQLSGGQQQRVAIARALVIDPRVLLLDEPFGALDRKLRESMQQELRALTRRLGITAILVTHDQEEALILSDRIAVMNAGRIEQQGTPTEIFEAPATPFVADFMGVQNLFTATVAHRDGSGAGLRIGRDWCAWPSAAALAEGTTVSLGIRPERIALREPSRGLPGVVEEVLYSGAFTRYGVRHAGSDLRFVVNAPSDAMRGGPDAGAGTTWSEGQAVGIEWADHALMRLDEPARDH